MITVNGQNGTMIVYDNFTTLSSHKTFTSLKVEYIVTTFKVKTCLGAIIRNHFKEWLRNQKWSNHFLRPFNLNVSQL
jgi:hypothetical protein